ncbi:unnamed protein product [Lymnaea stagnalis]|uniref:Uncharacterized protein n=1 Tax=Lymnaea stagnalis TaxID=6523 RepID=A0AAV2HWU4_LYMST
MALASTSAYIVPKTRCDNFCQHPSCWGYYSKGCQKSTSSLKQHHSKSFSEDSDDEFSLPTQSICNLLSDYGDREDNSNSNSAFETFGNKDDMIWSLSAHSIGQILKNSKTSHNHQRLGDRTTGVDCKDLPAGTSPSVKQFVRVQDVFNADAFQHNFGQESCPRHYVWVPRSSESRKKTDKSSITIDSSESSSVIVKDLTKTVLHPVILSKTDETSKKDKSNKAASQIKPVNSQLSMQRLKMSPSFYESCLSHMSPRHKLHPISKEGSVTNKLQNTAFTVDNLIRNKKVQLLKDPKGRIQENIESLNKPVFQLDINGVRELTSSDSVIVNEKRKHQETRQIGELPTLQPLAKIPSISLGLPELPSGLKTTKPFTYKKQDFDFSLGPVFSAPSSHRSVLSGENSKYGSARRAHGSPILTQQSQAVVKDLDGQSKRSASLSIHLPVPPVMTHKMDQPSSKIIHENVDQSILAINSHQFDQQGAVDQTSASRPTSAYVGEDSSVLVLTERDDKSYENVKLAQLRDRSQNTEQVQNQDSATAEESCPSPDQWPLVTESSFEEATKPPITEAGHNSKYEGQRNKAKVNHEMIRKSKVKDEKVLTDSPAPPPPSPEPRESSDMRRGNDLKALESVSMEPLFEVEESPTM